MRDPLSWRNKKVCVIGLARSGFACANLLHQLGACVSVSDSEPKEETEINAAKLMAQDIKVELGRHSSEFIAGNDLLVVSPGVADTSLSIVRAKELGIPVIGEIEFAWRLCPATVIAVTGTNGKTTVTTLIGNILQAKGKRVFVCGNIGTPFSAEVAKMESGDFVSLEVSSFQLEKIVTFKPKVSVILNFSRNHLDRYNDMAGYLEAKKRIFMNQDSNDYLVLNSQDDLLSGIGNVSGPKVVYFSQSAGLNPNQAAALTVGSLLDIEDELCFKVFKEFKGVEHRLEFVEEINGVSFINDSKATTVDSTVWALKNVPGPIILIAGGREKGNDYTLILDLIREKVKKVILIGEAKGRIKAALGDIIATQEAHSLEEAVRQALAGSRRGDVVLFSPMCKSFDMFNDYEHRGKVFKREVCALAKSGR